MVFHIWCKSTVLGILLLQEISFKILLTLLEILIDSSQTAWMEKVSNPGGAFSN